MSLQTRQPDKRSRKRWSVNLPGRIFVPERAVEGDCTVIDLSPDGAGLKTTCAAALGTNVVVYIDGFGRFEGTIVQRNRLRAGVRFVCTDARRAKIADMIANFVEHGTVTTTATRASTRIKSGTPLDMFKLSSGHSEQCQVIDMALSGALLKTAARPAIGEQITLGCMAGIVMRHTDSGIGVRFTGPRPSPAHAA